MELKEGIMLVSLDLESINDIDSLTKMLKLTFSNEDWHPMIRIADKLYEESVIVYDYLQQQRNEELEFRRTLYERPIIYYFGYSQLCKGIALQKIGNYQESRECIEKYQDLSWIKGINKKYHYIVEDYRLFAIGNTYTLELLEGNEEVLPEYVEYLKRNDGRILAGMITIFESAIKNDFSIEWVLEELAEKLDRINNNSDDLTKIRYFTEYLYLFSLYKYKQKDYDYAIRKNLEALTLCIILRDNTAFKKMVVLFENFRDHASKEQERNYKMQLKTILEGVLKDEKNISFDCIYPGYH